MCSYRRDLKLWTKRYPFTFNYILFYLCPYFFFLFLDLPPVSVSFCFFSSEIRLKHTPPRTKTQGSVDVVNRFDWRSVLPWYGPFIYCCVRHDGKSRLPWMAWWEGSSYLCSMMGKFILLVGYNGKVHVVCLVWWEGWSYLCCIPGRAVRFLLHTYLRNILNLCFVNFSALFCFMHKYLSIYLSIFISIYLSMDPHIWPSKSRTTCSNIHIAAMRGYGM